MSSAPTETAAPFPEIDAIYEAYRRKENIPGLAYGIIRNGRLVHGRGLGLARRGPDAPATAESFFRIASMTKCVTAIAVLLLRDRGKLGLDDVVADLVPAFAKVTLPTTDSRPITIRDLLTHLGGLVTDDPWGDRLIGQSLADFSAMLSAGHHFARAPRLEYEYSNLGFTLLGRVIEAASGELYTPFVTREILRAIGMARSSYEYRDHGEALALGYRFHDGGWTPARLEPDGAFGAMAGIVTNVVEYARFVAFLLDAWPARDGADAGPLSRASRRELASLHSEPRPPEVRMVAGKPVATASAYGYGLVDSRDGELGRYIHHRGGLPGYGSHFLFSPETGIGIFSFGNRTYAAMNEPNLEAAAALKAAGIWAESPRAVSAHIAGAADAVARMIRSGKLDAAGFPFAVNLLLDRPQAEREAELAQLAAKLGSLEKTEIVAIHPLHATLKLAGAKGKATVDLLLTGEATPTIQTLDFAAD